MADLEVTAVQVKGKSSFRTEYYNEAGKLIGLKPSFLKQPRKDSKTVYIDGYKYTIKKVLLMTEDEHYKFDFRKLNNQFIK